ncbi:phage tail termination protein [Streptomyces uncialis]
MSAPAPVDVELVLIGWLQVRLGPAVVVRDELDNNLVAELPTVQVETVGGDDDGFRLDRPLVDINVYASSRAAAVELAGRVRSLLLHELRGSTTATAVFGRVSTLTLPAPRPYENTALRRVGATYEVFCHPVS